MLPPVEDGVLQANPLFATLYNNLTTNILNLNGSTKMHPSQKDRDAVAQALKENYTRASKAHLLKSAIRNLDLSPTTLNSTTSNTSKAQPKQLSASLIELIILLSDRLNSTALSSPSTTQFLENGSQWKSLPNNLVQIGALVSTHLQTQAIALCRISSPNTNASFLHRLIPKLVPTIQARQAEIATQRHNLNLRRVELTGKVKVLLSLYHLASTLVILHLEQTVHGSLAREIKTKAELLGLMAQELELEAREKCLRGEREVYSAPVKSALNEYMGSLHFESERLAERKKDAQRMLTEYGVGQPDSDKEKIMRSIARKYAELFRELKEVRRDIDRLKGK